MLHQEPETQLTAARISQTISSSPHLPGDNLYV
jgi:hypothetical protein